VTGQHRAPGGDAGLAALNALYLAGLQWGIANRSGEMGDDGRRVRIRITGRDLTPAELRTLTDAGATTTREACALGDSREEHDARG
jgi:hypothetical protein